MKVICVIGLKQGSVAKNTNEVATKATEVYEGEVYNVVMEVNYEGKKAYVLAERQLNWAYLAHKFIPLSEIDETELIKEREDYSLSIIK